ncbi:MAG: hypothetical protein GY719_31125 [bacterium]|nr:hypothetical protein [bacterium]
MAIADIRPAPEWVDIGADLIRGLDLLGLRLPVQTVGSTLLTGVTTITPSIRYLSLHAWIVHSYGQARGPDRWKDFRDFASRVEAAVAVGNLLADPKMVGVIGSDKASKALEADEDAVHLEALVSQLAVSTYANPSQQLGLSFARDSSIPGLTKERGLPLAELVRGQMSGCRAGAAFSQGQRLGHLAVAELQEFGKLASLADIPPAEVDLLLEALLPLEPRPEDFFRVETYACLLALADLHSRPPRERDLFAEAHALERRLPEKLHEVLDGWLRYSVRDLLAAAHEAALKAIVKEVEILAETTGAAVASGTTIGALVAREGEQSDPLRGLGLIATDESPHDLSFRDLFERVHEATSVERRDLRGLHRWRQSLNEWDLIATALNSGAGALATLPVAWILATLRSEPWPDFTTEPFEQRIDVGWSRLGVFEIVAPWVRRFLREEWSLPKVMSELAHRTIDQHLRMAWARMAADPKRDVAVLVSDGDTWRHRGKVVVARRTASRLPQAISWLEQLRLIDSGGLTSEGEATLDRCLRTIRGATAP